ncbi:MAG: hypothetical protein PF961_09545 [Planctomycetota bacterium]|jgi:tetratricopeptide (TPR) repeat protein|nr:hypothetical protein [Planctomycetota bacterium]
MIRCFVLLVLACAGLTPTVSAEGVTNQIMGQDELDAKYTARRKELAADYRVERTRILPTLDSDYHRKAQQQLSRVRELLQEHRLPEARALAENAYEAYPYSYAADDLLHCLVRAYAVSGDLREARMYTLDLWERFPAYEHFRDLLDELLVVAEYVQQRGRLFNFDAETPREVIKDENLGDMLNANYLLFFLMRAGDQHVVAPRATLGLARGMLIQAGTSQDDLIEARLAYDNFLDSYPDSPLVFEALVEQAVSYLLSYRGDRYDMGSLISAKQIIEQADLYTRGDPDRQAVISKFRTLIRRWHQERDLQIANWYEDKGHYGPARHYYNEVIGRDATSKAAAEARRKRAELPQAESGLGNEQP